MADLEDMRSVLYDDCPYSNFPDAVDTFTRKADADIDTKRLLDTYNMYIDSNRLDDAKALVRNNPSLAKVLMNAEDWNRLRDGLVAVERVFNAYIADYIAHVVKNKGDWDAATQYRKYDAVFYEVDGAIQTFVALPADETITDIPVGTLPTDTDYWMYMSIRGAQGTIFTPHVDTVMGGHVISWTNDGGKENPQTVNILDGQSGSGLSPRGQYDSGVTYFRDDLVIYKDTLWYALQETIGEEPGFGAEAWGFLGTLSSNLYYATFTITPADWIEDGDGYKCEYMLRNITTNSRVDVLFSESTKYIARNAYVSTTTYTIQDHVVLTSGRIPDGNLTGQFSIMQRVNEGEITEDESRRLIIDESTGAPYLYGVNGGKFYIEKRE